MAMKNPPHPGLSVRHDCIEPLDLSITEAADILGVTRQTLNNLVNGKRGISPEMAIRLDKAFGGAETTLRLQMAYDLAQARKHEGEIKEAGCAAEGWTSRAPEVKVKPDGAHRAATHAGQPFGYPNGRHSATERDVVGVLRSRPHGGADQDNAGGVSSRLEQCLHH